MKAHIENQISCGTKNNRNARRHPQKEDKRLIMQKIHKLVESMKSDHKNQEK